MDCAATKRQTLRQHIGGFADGKQVWAGGYGACNARGNFPGCSGRETRRVSQDEAKRGADICLFRSRVLFSVENVVHTLHHTDNAGRSSTSIRRGRREREGFPCTRAARATILHSEFLCIATHEHIIEKDHRRRANLTSPVDLGLKLASLSHSAIVPLSLLAPCFPLVHWV